MSLRRRNRLNAMRSVQAAALDLFEEGGFEQVAVEQVASAAGVSPSTVYRHFGTKEQLVLWDEADARIEKALGGTLGKHAPLQALRLAFAAAYSDLSPAERKLQHRRGRLIDREPALLGATAASLQEGRLELEQAMVKIYRAAYSPLEVELACRIAFAALIAGFERWQAGGVRGSLPGAIEEAFDAAERVSRDS